MASFRVRTPAEYLRMLWKRKFFVLVPMIIVTCTLAYVIYRLPDVYMSETMILVEQSRVSNNVVAQPTQIDISSRLGTIRNLVTSRTELKGIIDNFNLYSDLRSTNVPEEEVMSQMTKHITIDVKNTGSGANAFTIAFRGPSPEIAQMVTSELATRFINVNMTQTSRENIRVMEQIEDQLAQRRKDLEKIEAERARMQVEHPEVFEGNDKTIIGQVSGLQMQRQSMQSSIDSLRNNIVMLEQMLKSVSSNDYTLPESTKTFGEMQTDAALRSKKSDLQAKLVTLLKIYKEKYPEVQEVRAQIEAVDNQIKVAKDDAKNERDEAKEARDKEIAIRKKPDIDGLNLRITGSNRELEIKQNELNQLQAEINRLNSKLQLIPTLQANMQKVQRDYNTIKKDYDDLLTRKNNAELGTKLAGELSDNTFRLQDPANLPQKPTAPTRGILYPLSLLIGLASGLVIAMVIESRSLFTIQDARDVEHYMHLPLLVTVPQIITDAERRQRAMLRLIQVAGVLLLILVAIPVLITVIQRSRVLNIFAGVY